MSQSDQPTMVHTTFPLTGQPIRVVVIDGEPWFAAQDVCRVLDRGSVHKVVKVVADHEVRVLHSHGIKRTTSPLNPVSAGGNGSLRGNPRITVISESGLYTLIMRSQKPTAKPFQRWVVDELLPSIRRGDTDVHAQRLRMAETLTEAIGQDFETVLWIDSVEDGEFRVMSDGTVHCAHGVAEICFPSPEEDSGPPFGPFFRCSATRRVGIQGSRSIRPCGTVRLTDLIRQQNHAAKAACAPRPPEPPTDPTGDEAPLSVSLSMSGSLQQISALLRKVGA